MRRTRIAVAGIALLALIITAFRFASSAMSTADDTSIAIVVRTSGTAELKSASSGIWSRAARGSKLDAQSSVRTGKGSNAIVLFNDGSVLRLDAQTEAKILGTRTADGAYTQKQVAVSKGLLGFDVKASAAQPYRFSSPTASAAIKGTQGTVAIGADADAFSLISSESDTAEIADVTLNSGGTSPLAIGEEVRATRAGAFERRRLRAEELRALAARIVERRSIRKQDLEDLRFRIREEAEERRNDRDERRRKLEEERKQRQGR